jgi:hypothetical protein
VALPRRRNEKSDSRFGSLPTRLLVSTQRIAEAILIADPNQAESAIHDIFHSKRTTSVWPNAKSVR